MIRVKVEMSRIMEGMPAVIQRIKEEAAQILLHSVLEIFQNQGLPNEPWKELSQFTIGKKHSRSILIDKGMLMNSIMAGPVTEGQPVEVGIFGGPTIEYAWIHEFGAEIPVTDAMRSFFKAKTIQERQTKPKLPPDQYQWYPLKEDTEVISIPPRPYLRWGAKLADPKIQEMAQRYWHAYLATGLVEA